MTRTAAAGADRPDRPTGGSNEFYVIVRPDRQAAGVPSGDPDLDIDPQVDPSWSGTSFAAAIHAGRLAQRGDRPAPAAMAATDAVS